MSFQSQSCSSFYSVVNSEDISSYEIHYNNNPSSSSASISSSYAYVHAANITGYRSAVYSTVESFKLQYMTQSHLLEEIDSIFSPAYPLDKLKFSKLKKDNNSTPFSPPSLIQAQISRLCSIPTKDLTKSYNESFQSFVPKSAYPIATRYISSDGTIFVERPPFQAVVDYKPGAASAYKKKLPPKTVWIPWTIYVFNPNYPGGSQYMYFSHKSLTSMSDNYYPTYLPNTYPDSRICYSGSLSDLPLESANTTPASLYAYMINEFFAGSWNADLSNSWLYLYTSKFYHQLNAKNPNPKFLSSIPNLIKLFSPDEETMEKAGLNKISKIYSIYKSAPSKFFANLPHDYSHYAILSIISTFTLSEVLALLEEIDFMYQDIDKNKDNSIFASNYHNPSAFKPISFESITSQHKNYRTLDGSYIRNLITSISAKNMSYAEYDSSTTNIILVNSPVAYSPMNYLSNGLSNGDIPININKSVLNSLQNSSIPIYNFEDSKIYFINPSSSDMTLHDLYLEMLKVYIENDFYFPCQSTALYDVVSKDEYVKL